MDQKRLEQIIGSTDVEEYEERMSGSFDNVAIALASYFEDHMNRPEEDPPDDTGWGEWVVKKTNKAISLIAGEILKELEEERCRTTRILQSKPE